jgi:hypothetical protein
MFDTKVKPLFFYFSPKFPLSTSVERGTVGEVFQDCQAYRVLKITVLIPNPSPAKGGGEDPNLSNHPPVFK